MCDFTYSCHVCVCTQAEGVPSTLVKVKNVLQACLEAGASTIYLALVDGDARFSVVVARGVSLSSETQQKAARQQYFIEREISFVDLKQFWIASEEAAAAMPLENESGNTSCGAHPKCGDLSSPDPQDYSKIMDNGAAVDVNLLVDGHMFPAHRRVLEEKSAYFNDLFKSWSGSIRSDNRQEVLLEDVGSGAAFRVLMRFMYTRALPATEDCGEELEAGEMAKMAEQFGVVELYEHCAGQFRKGLTTENAIQRLAQAHTSGLVELQQVVMEYVLVTQEDKQNKPVLQTFHKTEETKIDLKGTWAVRRQDFFQQIQESAKAEEDENEDAKLQISRADGSARNRECSRPREGDLDLRAKSQTEVDDKKCIADETLLSPFATNDNADGGEKEGRKHLVLQTEGAEKVDIGGNMQLSPTRLEFPDCDSLVSDLNSFNTVNISMFTPLKQYATHSIFTPLKQDFIQPLRIWASRPSVVTWNTLRRQPVQLNCVMSGELIGIDASMAVLGRIAEFGDDREKCKRRGEGMAALNCATGDVQTMVRAHTVSGSIYGCIIVTLYMGDVQAMVRVHAVSDSIYGCIIVTVHMGDVQTMVRAHTVSDSLSIYIWLTVYRCIADSMDGCTVVIVS